MGMTIDEALKIIKDGRIVATAIRGNNEDDTKFNTDNIEALHVIEDTMRKYQKIVPALVNYDLLNPIADVKTIEGEGIYINLSDLQDYIQRVLEDGKID